MPVHQFLPSLSEGDAIGHHVLRMHALLKGLGPSKIYVERADASLQRVVEPYQSFRPEPGDVAVYHASIGCQMARHLLRLPVPVVVDYHNVTPMAFFTGFEPRIAALCHAGRRECAAFAERSPLGLADSSWSARELDAMGYRRTETIPILLDLAKYDRPPDAALLDRLRAGKRGADLLFVGRIAPQKRQEDVIKAFALYRRHFDPGARLFLVGRSSSERYLETLHAFVAHVGVGGVHLVGGVSDAALIAHYRAADVFLSMSEHEGFCVPLVESMRFDLPVVAHAAGAVPETLGGAGVLVHEKRYEEVAALVDVVVRDAGLRRGLVEAGRARLEHFRPERHEARLVELIGSVG